LNLDDVTEDDMKRILFSTALAALLIMPFAKASGQEASVAGSWTSPDQRARVDIRPCGGAPSRFCGAIVWVDPRERDGAQALGLQVFSDFERAGREWRGRVLDLDRELEFPATLSLIAGGRMRLRACSGPLCETEVWSRASSVSRE
jgi:uncharacterized protein (DUF2147 family)